MFKKPEPVPFAAFLDYTRFTQPFFTWKYAVSQRQLNDRQKEIDFEIWKKNDGSLKISIADLGGHASDFPYNGNLESLLEKTGSKNPAKIRRIAGPCWEFTDVALLKQTSDAILKTLRGPFAFLFEIRWVGDHQKDFLEALGTTANLSGQVGRLLKKNKLFTAQQHDLGNNQRISVYADKKDALLVFKSDECIWRG